MSIATYWLIGGAVLLALEAFGIPGIGFLFLALGALLTGLGIELGLIGPADLLVQWVVFFLASSLFAIALWNRLKQWRMSPSSGDYQNMVGTEAVVTKTLSGDAEGEVRWSGTLMRARLVQGTEADVITGSIVVIREVEGNLLRVVPKQ